MKIKKLFLKKIPSQKYNTEANHRFNYSKLVKKTIQELQGISTALIYDGKIDDAEIKLLKEWLQKNDEYLYDYPLSDLRLLFNEIDNDGKVSLEERQKLMTFLNNIAASPNSSPTIEGIYSASPTIKFMGKNFLFTGDLMYGPRSKAQEKVIELGGNCMKSITMTTDYLVVGILGSKDYRYSRFGTKIETAIKFNREMKSTILIIKEQDFVNAIINN